MTLTIAVDPVPLRMDADGVVRVGRTRVTLDTVVTAFQEGATADEIARQYSALSLADIYAVFSYFLRHRPEVEAYLDERRKAAEAVRRSNEARFSPRGVRERLVSRRAAEADKSG